MLLCHWDSPYFPIIVSFLAISSKRSAINAASAAHPDQSIDHPIPPVLFTSLPFFQWAALMKIFAAGDGERYLHIRRTVFRFDFEHHNKVFEP
jgi:hypothetical protein